MSLKQKNVSRREFLYNSTKSAAGIITVAALTSSAVRADEKDFRIGFIGLDTSHVIAFTKYINVPEKNLGCRIVPAGLRI